MIRKVIEKSAKLKGNTGKIAATVKNEFLPVNLVFSSYSEENDCEGFFLCV